MGFTNGDGNGTKGDGDNNPSGQSGSNQGDTPGGPSEQPNIGTDNTYGSDNLWTSDYNGLKIGAGNIPAPFSPSGDPGSSGPGQKTLDDWKKEFEGLIDPSSWDGLTPDQIEKLGKALELIFGKNSSTDTPTQKELRKWLTGANICISFETGQQIFAQWKSNPGNSSDTDVLVGLSQKSDGSVLINNILLGHLNDDGKYFYYETGNDTTPTKDKYYSVDLFFALLHEIVHDYLRTQGNNSESNDYDMMNKLLRELGLPTIEGGGIITPRQIYIGPPPKDIQGHINNLDDKLPNLP